jgi:leucine dehydrogenase
LKEGTRLVVADIYEGSAAAARKLGAEVISPDAIYGVACDVFSPCALGGVLNGESIRRLKCKVVAGGANNQLASPADAEALQRRGILYAPDFIVNAGGIINASCEVGAPYSAARAKEMTERIYETTERVIQMARKDETTAAAAADRLAEERLNSVRKVRKTWR